MAHKGDIDHDLVFEIDGENITPEKFIRGVRAFFALLADVTETVCEGREQVAWRVQVKEGSNLVEAVPLVGAHSEDVGAIIDRVGLGVATIEDTDDDLEGWSPRAINSFKDMGVLSGVNDDDDTVVRVWVRREPLPITHRTVARVAEINRLGYKDYGSVEGRLQVLSERGSLHIMVYEPVWDKPIRCYIDEDLLNRSRESFGKRVEIYGEVKYRPDGSPMSIKAEEIVAFPDTDSIPSATDVQGILRNFQ